MEINPVSTITASDAAKAVVRRNTEEVQSGGNFDVSDELFADDFIDHTPQPNTTPDKKGVRKLYSYLRTAFPDFHAEIHWQLVDGERVATLFHFSCGDRAAEAYGGMTDAGADSRANYLLKWEAIRAFRAGGFASYDLWGIATGGIAHFKEGFGGRQVDYVGARDLPLRPAHDAALRLLLPAYGIAQRARLRLTGHRLAGSDD